MKSVLNSLDPGMKKLIKTFLIVIGAVVVLILGIFIIKLVVGTKVSYEKLENIIEASATSYFEDSEAGLPTEEGETKKVDVDELIAGGYMKTMDKYTEDTCSGTVSVTNNGGNYLYTTMLDCNEYKTKTLASVIEASLTDSGDGLYFVNNEYYYRGEYVDNYIRIDNQLYRILGIDSNGYIKVIDPTIENKSYPWDDRYNSEREQDRLGVNDYVKSRLKEAFDTVYDSYIDSLKKYIVNYNWCIGKRAEENGDINPIECSNYYTDYVSTILPSEFIRISLDTECNSLFAGSCKNYNYLSSMVDVSIWTLSASSNTTYESFYIDSGLVSTARTMRQYKLLKSFNISGNNIYLSGDGTEANPYMIK